MAAANDLPELRSCEELTDVPMCTGLYNKTSLPNLRGHQTQEEANTELVEFSPLVSSNCTQYLRHFLCSYYVPLCEVYLPPELTVPPCRELCTHVYLSCNYLLVNYSMKWPQHLSCDLFPAKTQTPWCFGPDDPQILEPQDPVASSTWITGIMSPTHTTSQSYSHTQEGSHSTQVQPFHTHTAQSQTHTAQSQSGSSHLIGPTPPTAPPICTSIPANSFCQDVGYTKTTFPNALGQANADEVEYELNNLALLTYMQCSPNITSLLCRYYMPECRDEPPYIIQPCRELCESVKTQCSQTLKRFNMELLTNINCDILPSSSSSSCSNEGSRDNPTTRGETGGIGSASNKKLDILQLIILVLICMLCAVLY